MTLTEVIRILRVIEETEVRFLNDTDDDRIQNPQVHERRSQAEARRDLARDLRLACMNDPSMLRSRYNF